MMARFPSGRVLHALFRRVGDERNQRYGLNKYSAALCTANRQSSRTVRAFVEIRIAKPEIKKEARRSRRLTQMATSSLSSACICVICGQFGTGIGVSIVFDPWPPFALVASCATSSVRRTSLSVESNSATDKDVRRTLVAATGRAKALCASANSANSAFNFDVNHLNAESAETQRRKNALRLRNLDVAQTVCQTDARNECSWLRGPSPLRARRETLQCD